MDRVVLPSRPEQNRLFAALPGPRVAKAEILASVFIKEIPMAYELFTQDQGIS